MMLAGSAAMAGLASSGLYAAWSDLRSRRLSNRLCLVVALAGICLQLSLGGAAAAASAALHGTVALMVGAVLFGFGGLGGGDVKYYAAVACWFQMSRAVLLLGTVSIAGFVLAAGWLLAIRMGIRQGEGQAEGRRNQVPFGIAIAIGAVVAAGSQA